MTKTQIILNKLIRKWFHKIGLVVGTHPIKVIVIAVLISFILIGCGQHFAKKREKDFAYLYTPADAPSLNDYEIAKAFFKTTGDQYHLEMAVIMRNASNNILDSPFSDAVLDVREYFFDNFSSPEDSIPFKNLCGSKCDSNSVIPKIFALKNSQRSRQLTYPTFQVYGMSLYMGDHFHSIQVGKDNALESAESCSLLYTATYYNESQGDILKRWELALMKSTQELNYPHADILKVYVYSQGLATTEVIKSGYEAAKYFSITSVFLLAFTIISCMKPESYLSKPWEGVAGVVNPLISLMTAFGFLFLIGYSFIDHLVVCPFLVFAIGVDDCFVMMHSWRTSSAKLSPAERLADTLSDCGPAIALTSLTNTVSFAIGHFSSTDSVSIFCTFTALSMFIDFIYQITFFAAVLAIGGRREAQKKNGCLCCLPVKISTKMIDVKEEHGFWYAVSFLRESASKFGTNYTRFLITKKARFLAVCICIPYWVLAIYFTTKLQSTLSSEKLFIRGSSINEYLKWTLSASWLESMPMHIFILKSPDLRPKNNLAQILQMVNDFESTRFSVGNSSTQFWLNEYLSFLNFFGSVGLNPMDHAWNMEHPVYDNRYLIDFMEMQPQWTELVHFDRTGLIVEQFHFQTSYKNIQNWVDMSRLHNDVRTIAKAYADFDVHIFQPLTSFYADQVDSIGPVTLQTILITFLCMGVICLVLIPELISCFSSVCCLMSINIGVFGFYKLWHIDLDPISMMNSLFSLGLSIDFVSHVSYHFFSPERRNLETFERLHATLAGVAWPILQAGISTVISVSPLWLNNAYLTDVFAKTVVLVVMLGLVHGLFLLPVFLCSLPTRNCFDIKSKVRIAPMPIDFSTKT